MSHTGLLEEEKKTGKQQFEQSTKQVKVLQCKCILFVNYASV